MDTPKRRDSDSETSDVSVVGSCVSGIYGLFHSFRAAIRKICMCLSALSSFILKGQEAKIQDAGVCKFPFLSVSLNCKMKSLTSRAMFK